MFSIVFYRFLLFCIVLYCSPLFSIVFYCFLLFSIVFYSFPLFSIVFKCFPLFSIVFYSSPLFSIALYCFQLFSIVLILTCWKSPVAKGRGWSPPRHSGGFDENQIFLERMKIREHKIPRTGWDFLEIWTRMLQVVFLIAHRVCSDDAVTRLRRNFSPVQTDRVCRCRQDIYAPRAGRWRWGDNRITSV